MGPDFQAVGRALLILGAICAGLGALLVFSPKVPWLGRLPGDLLIQREHFTFYMPLVTCLLVSVVISFFLWWINHLR